MAAVTGAGAGLGRAAALALAGAGASVALNDLDELALAETVQAVEEAGGRAVGRVGDVSLSLIHI